MNAETVLANAEMQRQEGEKGQLLRGLNAILLTTPYNRPTTRNYIQNAIEYIEKN